MNSQTLGLRVASVLFGLMSLAQLGRLIVRPEVFVGDHHLPLWPSALAFLVFAALCVWLWVLSRPSVR